MEKKLEQLIQLMAEYIDLRHAAAVLEWDQQCYMPEGSSDSRSHQLATLQRLAHERLTSEQVGEALEALKPLAKQWAPDSDEARLIKITDRQYQKYTRVPSSLIADFYKTTAQAYIVWMQAREENNFAKFQPYLERIVNIRREYASYFSPYEHIYDPLLDDFEPGIKTSEILKIFDQLRPQQIELLKMIAQKPQVDNSFLYLSYDPNKQWQFGKEVISTFGYDWEHGRLDKSAHPFTIHFGSDDVRITTRIDPEFFNTAFFSTLHECGHGLYEQGSASQLERTPLAGGASLGIHESQSRMWENLVGRSRSFWEYFYPKLQTTFPAQLGNIDLETFYKGVNRVEPSLIRVEADEATYNLHIMLRLEIEIGILDGTMEIQDLPEIWNSRMKEYLGITPPNDAQGVLQDVHWSSGHLGYFPTYSLGNIIAVQFWEKINQDLPNLDEMIAQGSFEDLLSWIREHIHIHGKKFEPQELVHKVTGNPIDPAPYMRYLRKKYSAIYNL